MLRGRGHGPPAQGWPVDRLLHTACGAAGPVWWYMFHASTSPLSVRCSTGVKPSPPVDWAVGRTGGRRSLACAVPPGRAAGWLARTARVAVPGSLPVKVVPSEDQAAVQPGGTFSEPGTYVWAVPAPAMGSVMTAGAGAPGASLD